MVGGDLRELSPGSGGGEGATSKQPLPEIFSSSFETLLWNDGSIFERTVQVNIRGWVATSPEGKPFQKTSFRYNFEVRHDQRGGQHNSSKRRSGRRPLRKILDMTWDAGKMPESFEENRLEESTMVTVLYVGVRTLSRCIAWITLYPSTRGF